MARKKRPYTAGDLVALPLPNERFAVARVQLDVDAQCVEPKRIERSSPLFTFSGTVLLEVYQGASAAPAAQTGEVAIPGVFVDPERIGGGPAALRWKVIGHAPVDPARVEFPEALVGSRGYAGLVRGELQREISMSADHLKDYPCRPTVIGPAALIHACCYYLGFRDLLGEDVERRSLKGSDLRFTDYRDEIYGLLGEDPRLTYHEMAAKAGLDLARFYG